MKKLLYSFLVVVLLLGILGACLPKYQIKSVDVGDENIWFKLCYPSNHNCATVLDANPLPHSQGKQPKPDMWCSPIFLGSSELNCGKGYYHLLVLTPPN